MHNFMSKNQSLVAMIRRCAQHGTIPHAIILSGTGDRLSAARFTAAALVCRAADGRPCLQCSACRKVLQDIHPDVSFQQDPEHKELQVEAVRQMRQDVYIRPNDGERKIYIFPDSRQLNTRNQDVLLKIVEEGPAYAAFLFCTESASTLLPTIRSRCVEWKLLGDEARTDQQAAAQELCRILAGRDPLPATQFLVGLEGRRMTREQLQNLLLEARLMAVQALRLQCGAPAEADSGSDCVGLLSRGLSRRQLSQLIELLDHYSNACRFNVGIGHVLGAVAARWEGICTHSPV